MAQLPSMQMSEPQQSTLEAHSSPMRLHSHAPSTQRCTPTQSLSSSQRSPAPGPQ
jgi:hypothetical protein